MVNKDVYILRSQENIPDAGFKRDWSGQNGKTVSVVR